MSEQKHDGGRLGARIAGACKKVEDTVVGGYKKVEGAFDGAFLEQSADGAEEPGADAAGKGAE